MQTAEKRKYTANDYMALEEGAPFQLIEGELIMSPLPIIRYQQIIGNLYMLLYKFLADHKFDGTLILSPMDIILDDENILQPDLLYISPERKHIIEDRVNGAPDLVIEVLSPSNAYCDLKRKKKIYERFGVREYLIADPETNDIQQYILEDSCFSAARNFVAKEAVDLHTISGLSLPVENIFR